MKNLKVFFIGSLLFILFSCCFIRSSFASEIIYIDSVDDYIMFAKNNEAYNGYKNMIVILTTDLDFEGAVTPMVEGEFKGVFDGQGHKFKNINICEESGSDYMFYTGLFEENEGLIRRVIVESGKVVGDGTTGVICGTNSGIVEQCENYVNIESTFVIGGIVGWNEGQGIVRICLNRGNSNDLKPGTGGTIGFGGIVGSLYSGTIIDCYNTGIITPERDSSKGSITGGYYRNPTEYEYIDNCFTTIISDSNYRDEYVVKVTKFDGGVYSLLNQRGKYFYSDGGEYPKINMEINAGVLPERVMLKEIFEKKSIFDNYDSFIKEIDNLGERVDEEEIIPYKEDVVEESKEIYQIEENNESDDVTQDIKTTNNNSYIQGEHHNYVSIKKEDIDNASLKKPVTNEKKELQMDNSLRITLVGGGMVAIMLVFIKAINDNNTVKNGDDDSHIP